MVETDRFACQNAVRTPHECFADEELARARPEQDQSGRTLARHGEGASVFFLHSPTRKLAVKCYFGLAADRATRYAALQQTLLGKVMPPTVPTRAASGTQMLPGVVSFEYLEQGIRIEGRWYPILKMDQVEGALLCDYLQQRVNDPQSLRRLSQRYLDLSRRWRSSRVAHGDLQPTNIFVVDDSIMLVDYDAAFVPSLGGLSCPEPGSEHFQHPLRNPRHFGEYLDNFADWVIYTSLVAVSIDMRFWQFASPGEHLLIFRRRDFLSPQSSEVFHRLRTHSSAELRQLVLQLESMLTLPVEQLPRLNVETTGGNRTQVPRSHPMILDLAPASQPRSHPAIIDDSCGPEAKGQALPEPLGIESQSDERAKDQLDERAKEQFRRGVKEQPPLAGRQGSDRGGLAMPSVRMVWLIAGVAILTGVASVALLVLRAERQTGGSTQPGDRSGLSGSESVPDQKTAPLVANAGNGLMSSQDKGDRSRQASHAVSGGGACDEGFVFLRRGDYQRAVSKFSQALQSRRDNVIALGGRADAYMKLKRYGEALDDYDRAIALKGDDKELFRGRGLAYLSLEQYLKAIADYKKARSLGVDDALVYSDLGRCYGGLGEYPQALSYFTEALERKQNANSYYLRGGTYYCIEKYPEALADYKQATILNPSDADAWYGMGSSLYCLRRYREAQEPYRRAIALYKARGDHAWVKKAEAFLREVSAR